MVVTAPDHRHQNLPVNICQPVDVQAGGAGLVLAEGFKLRPGIGPVRQPVQGEVGLPRGEPDGG